MLSTVDETKDCSILAHFFDYLILFLGLITILLMFLCCHFIRSQIIIMELCYCFFYKVDVIFILLLTASANLHKTLKNITLSLSCFQQMLSSFHGVRITGKQFQLFLEEIRVDCCEPITEIISLNFSCHKVYYEDFNDPLL